MLLHAEYHLCISELCIAELETHQLFKTPPPLGLVLSELGDTKMHLLAVSCVRVDVDMYNTVCTICMKVSSFRISTAQMRKRVTFLLVGKCHMRLEKPLNPGHYRLSGRARSPNGPKESRAKSE